MVGGHNAKSATSRTVPDAAVVASEIHAACSDMITMGNRTRCACQLTRTLQKCTMFCENVAVYLSLGELRTDYACTPYMLSG